MKPFAKVIDFCEMLFDRRLLLSGVARVSLLGPLAVVADGHVEIRDLVRILTRSWHLDWARPVEVVVAKCEGQLLDLHFLE